MQGLRATANPDAVLLRDLLISALPEDTSLHGAIPEPQHIYLPASHAKALHPNVMVVVGMRGSGKSFWWGALQNPEIRALISRIHVRSEVQEETQVELGFGEAPRPADYPDRDTLQALLQQGIEPRMIWRAIVTYKIVPSEHVLRSEPSWSRRVQWVADNPELVARLLHEHDQDLDSQNKWLLVLFDALDRCANNWHDANKLIRGLLQTALDLRPYRRLRMKCFLRTDQLQEGLVADFPDASKILGPKIELTWPFTDLYGMLWQYLANTDHEGAAEFRRFSEQNFGFVWSSVQLGQRAVWRQASEFTFFLHDAAADQKLFHALAGPWMGRDRRRGRPYTWVPNHLADAHGQTSPRSFLAAIRAAAVHTQQTRPGHDRSLHYESIKSGVQVASQIRVQEIKEDYPWVDDVMRPLAGLVVPCEFSQVEARWREHQVLAKLGRMREGGVRLPPAHWEEGFTGLRHDLEHLGIFVRLQDNRVNIPDVFRVGYGLGRRGGVKPLARREQITDQP